MPELTTIDLFSGAGGITEGYREAGFKCLYANDFDESAVDTFRLNHADTWADCAPIEDTSPGSIRRRLGLRKGELTVLVGGPPCQGFSINAPERFMEDARNALFRHYMRFVDEFAPKTLMIENVPGMLSLANGRIYRKIVSEVSKRGYSVSERILFAAHYGVPQERWRLILLGSRIGPEMPHPEPTHFAQARANFRGGRDMTFRPESIEGRLDPHVTVAEAIGDLPPLKVAGGTEEAKYSKPPHSEYAKRLRNGSKVLLNHVAPRLAPINIERMKYVKPGGSWRDIPHHLLPSGMKRARRSDHTKRYGRLNSNGLAGTVMTKCDPHWGTVILPDQDRTLTVRESARLQSFPDSYRFLGTRGSQYEQVGNAVPVLLAKAVAERLSEYLEIHSRARRAS